MFDADGKQRRKKQTNQIYGQRFHIETWSRLESYSCGTVCLPFLHQIKQSYINATLFLLSSRFTDLVQSVYKIKYSTSANFKGFKLMIFVWSDLVFFKFARFLFKEVRILFAPKMAFGTSIRLWLITIYTFLLLLLSATIPVLSIGYKKFLKGIIIGALLSKHKSSDDHHYYYPVYHTLPV